ncbi:transcription factor Sp2 [Drosophila takahashii]|uniref:transcription factor Sp2 n=1 Tax=Drosophila takahashii TaxID=29030 RepID=UPI001CF88535|nr:proline-rich protein 36 [Drosophila takahashii]
MAAAGSNVRCINYYDLCRICTDSSDHKTNIYSPEGRAKNLSHKILECLSLQIDEKDRLPKVVCAQCVQQVEQIHGLRATCRNSQTMLSNCLNIRPAPSSDKLYIRDAIDETGKSLSVAQAAPVATGGSQQSGNLLNSIIQAVGMQPQQQYTITVDNGVQQQLPEVQVKSERQSALEEFIRLKPDIKITPLGKKEAVSPPKPQQPPPLQPPTVTTTINTPQLQLQPQLGDQLQPLWQQIQQLQLQQQLQQLTNQLQATTQFSAAAQEDAANPGDSKKPKLNFVLSSQATPQFTTSLPQFAGSQPQIQLQLMPGGGGVTNASAAPAQPQFNAAALLSSLAAPQSTPNLLSPNKCFLPITIRDENSDQQIVAHIDTKNLVLPTTYQVQMKLQPQLATADGQPIMQLTPTSIPATLQLTPQTLGNPGSSFQGTTVAQNQFLAPPQPPPPVQQQQPLTQLPNTAQVTSQQIIRSPQTSTTNPQLVIRNVTNIPTTPSTPTSSKEAPTFKTPPPKQRQMASPKSKTPVASPSGGSSSPSTNEFKRLMAQAKQQPQVKQQQPTAAATVAAPQQTTAAMQRLSSNTTITKVAKQPVSAPAAAAAPAPAATPAKLPVLNKQNITISRISMQAATKPQTKPSPPPAPAQPIPLPVPALNQAQPPPLAAQHKKIVRKPPENQEKAKPARPPQQILPSPNQEGENATSTATSDALLRPLTAVLVCPTCKREFKKKEHLTQHVKLHAGLRPFKCSEEGCDKTFSRKEHLSRHLISHSGQKMYTCEVCKKPFSRKDNLNKHKRIHTQPANETLYCCDVCNKNFATKLHYEKHREMHKKVRPESAAPASTAPPAATPAPAPVRSNGQVPNKAVYEIKPQRNPQQQPTQSQSQPAQIMHVVTTQDLAGNTITITQAPDSNMPASLANYVQLGFSQFQNPSAPAAKQN